MDLARESQFENARDTLKLTSKTPGQSIVEIQKQLLCMRNILLSVKLFV